MVGNEWLQTITRATSWAEKTPNLSFKKSTIRDDNSIRSRKDNHNQFIIGGSQAPELELQHEMNHFPSFPISKSTTRVPRGDYSTRRIPTGQCDDNHGIS